MGSFECKPKLIAGSFGPEGKIWVMELKRMMLGQEKLSMMGVHACDMPKCLAEPQRSMHVMAGDMVSLFSCGAYLVALLSSVPL